MKRVLLKSLLAAAVVAMALPGAAQTKLKWAHVYETSEPYHTESVWAAEEIKKRTNGKYEITVFPASQLGKESDINQGLTLGTVDIILTGQNFAARAYGPMAVGGAPFMFRDFEHWQKYVNSPVFAELSAGRVTRGCRIPVAGRPTGGPGRRCAAAAIRQAVDRRDRAGCRPAPCRSRLRARPWPGR